MTRIPMLDLVREYEYMKQEIDEAIARCLTHQKWILGPEVGELENTLAAYLGVEHCIGVSSGTDALVMALRALAITRKGKEYFDRNDEIITTPFTFVATGDAILRAGATPVFVDIDPLTFNIDPSAIRRYLSSARESSRTTGQSTAVVGILPVHLYGQACAMDEIMAIADEYGLFIVEDVAQALGARHGGRKAGSMGAAGALSFFPSKNLGGFGDGGMVTTNNKAVADMVRMLLRHGGRDKYNVDHIGYNGRIDTLQAAILLAKVKYLERMNDRRRKAADFYTGHLSDLKGVTLPVSGPVLPGDHVFHQYTLRVLKGKRDDLQKHLREMGVESMVYYPHCLHEMRLFKDRCSVPQGAVNAEKAAKEVLSIPIEPLYEKSELSCVAEALRSFDN